VDKDCENCKYTSIPAHKTPCFTCMVHEAWESVDAGPKFIKCCTTCKYEWYSLRTGPCKSCPGYVKWEPKETDPPKEDPGVEDANNEEKTCPFQGSASCDGDKCGIWVVDGRSSTGMCALVMMAWKLAER
jgi:hypothetical protein